VSSGITLRVAPDVFDVAGLVEGCVVTVESPLGHAFFAAHEAQVTAWELNQVTAVSGCDASIVSAVAVDATHVALTLSRGLDAATADFDAFINDPDAPLGVFDVVVDGKTVVLETDVQDSGTDYTIEAVVGVRDVFGNALDDLGRFIHFDGFTPLTGLGLVINEVDYDNLNADTDEWVEVINLGNDAVDLATVDVIFVDGLTGTLGRRIVGSGTLPPGGIGLYQFTANDLQNGPDAVALWDNAADRLLDAVVYEIAAVNNVTIDAVSVNLVGPNLTDAGTGSICRDPLTRIFEVCAATSKNAVNP
jgi:hypothetical protein